jgi:hypothetical protein
MAAALLDTAHVEQRFFDSNSQLVQMGLRFLRGFSLKQNGELFASDAERPAASSHTAKSRGHHAQNLIAGVVAIGVVETFEMVHVYDRNRIRLLEMRQRLIESPPSLQARQFVVIGEEIRILDDRADQNQTCGRHIGAGDPSDAAGFKSRQGCGERPQQAALEWLAIEEETTEQDSEGDQECQQHDWRQDPVGWIPADEVRIEK